MEMRKNKVLAKLFIYQDYNKNVKYQEFIQGEKFMKIRSSQKYVFSVHVFVSQQIFKINQTTKYNIYLHISEVYSGDITKS